MGWNLEGKRVNALYLGLFPYSGLVLSSRVKYGGAVQHKVRVDVPFKVYGEVRETVLVDSVEINRIIADNETV